MTNGCAVRLDVRSSLDMIDLVQAVCDRVGRAAGLDDDAMHQVDYAVRESVVNAITHGNQHDDAKRVHIEFTHVGDRSNPGIAVSVRDEGAGFDPGSVPDCCASENLLKASGRGIFLMRNFVDRLVHRRVPGGGMEVVIVKHVQPLQ
ncbi:MAG: ATP-binding protein [Acidobacteria bacterium]|nr:ATP-binding protein [Acidobacteriota bacterium]